MTKDTLLHTLAQHIEGDIAFDEQTLQTHSHDASIFEVIPEAVIFPKTEKDVETIIQFVTKHKKDIPTLSVTARSAGTDMGGGSLNTSLIVNFEKYFNNPINITKDIATTQPGVYYRDFEKQTLVKNLIFPSYPASRELCCMGGIVNNNSGGEKSLAYGKTQNYVEGMRVVLSDGNTYTFSKLSEKELEKKKKQKNFEGEIYRKMYTLITRNYDLLQKAKPKVSKNSAGYFLWDVYNPQEKTFDLTKLFVGAQGTLGFMTQADIKLVPIPKHREMMVIFLHDIAHLGDIINAVLPLKPESFESYDDNTLKLALRFFPAFAKLLGTKNIIQTGFQFLPEFFLILFGGMPKLVLQVDFTGDDQALLKEKIEELKKQLRPFHPKIRIAIENQETKYWLMRRESFNLLRQKIQDKHTTPFIDDFVVNPEYLPAFLPKLQTILKRYPSLLYTIAGHMGNGNFHIIPLMDLSQKEQQAIIPQLSEEVYTLVGEYKGSITGEHNDGLVRTPYLDKMYAKEILKLFEQTKQIFDPLTIFNPGKKVHGSLSFAMKHLRTRW